MAGIAGTGHPFPYPFITDNSLDNFLKLMKRGKQ